MNASLKMTSIMASQNPVSDDEICGDVPMQNTEPSSGAPGEVSTFTPINGQEDALPTPDEGEAGLEKVSHSSCLHHLVFLKLQITTEADQVQETANLDVNKTSPKKRAASNAPAGAKTSPTKKRAAPKAKKLAPKPSDQSDGAADVEDAITPTKKPATKAKAKKGTATKAIKSEPENNDADELAGSGTEPTPTPAKKAPKPKATKKAPAAKAIKKEVTPEQHDDDAAPASNTVSPSGSPSKVGNGDTLANGKPRKRQAPKNDTRTKAMIPKSYDEASEVDRMLYDLKEAGTNWKIICAKYEEMTGEEVGMK